MATLTETFTNIANSIRLKTETTDKITPENMPSMIEGITTGGNVMELSITSNGTYNAPEGIDGYTPVIVNVPQEGGPTAAELTLTGTLYYRFSSNGWNWIIEKYGNQITTENITILNCCFFDSDNLENIPFIINTNASENESIAGMFKNCKKLKNIPAVKNFSPSNLGSIFYDCWYLREIPDSFCDTWDWNYIETKIGRYAGEMNYMFKNCFSLRKLPRNFINHGNPKAAVGYTIHKEGFYSCYALDEIVDLSITNDANAYTSNLFSDTFYYCHRLKRLTFKINDDGTIPVVKWKSQTIDLTNYLGYANTPASITNYNSGLTTATQITDDATYQALKDNPDSWTTNINYSRYNRTSAVETINSLPDASAYLATQSSGTNTIKFRGAAGKNTDGGAINTMTEEEIAVATAKGWTVSFV